VAWQDEFVKARRAAIAAEFSRLNPEQRLGAMMTEGPVLMLAGAGSGKTTVLINRIANILKYGKGSDCDTVPDWAQKSDIALLNAKPEELGEEQRQRREKLMAVEPAPAWSVLAITFTNKAAGELKNRLYNMLGSEAEDIWASTFHSACVRILRREADYTPFESGFTIYDTADSLSLMKHVMKDLNMDEKTYPPRSVLSQISRAKDSMKDARTFAEEAGGDFRRKRIAEAYAEYSRRLLEANALDFDDIIFYTVRLLQENPQVREYYQRKFRYVLVDEYQDTNHAQFLLAELLSGGRKNICVVGDDDQSIYKFRGATIENILGFEEHYQNARVVRLEQNYRSTGNILNAANAVIKNNLGRKSKKLWTDSGDGEKVTVYTAATENDEAQYIAARILEGYERGERFSDFAVLYRMNAQSNQIEFAFKRNGIRYRVFGGFRFFDRAEVKDMLSYLNVINNPGDTLRLQRIVNNPPRGIGAKTLETVAEIAAREGATEFEIMERAAEYPELSRASAKITEFTGMINSLRAFEGPVDELYSEALEKTGYLAMLDLKPGPESDARRENLMELKTSIEQYMRETENATLAGYLDMVSLYTDIDKYDEDDDCVTMMTMHSAKGLEFPTVFVAGAEEGIFPGTRAIGDEEEIEEERRLCYVAITRAKKKLYITGARQRMMMGRTSNNLPSRFVDELPGECVEKKEAQRYAPTFGAYSSGDRGARESEGGYGYGRRKRPVRPPEKPAAPRPAAAPAAVDFRKGDAVEHKAFGKGVILSVQPTGGDALLEIAFDSAGTKRLMAKAASKFMRKG